MTAFLIVAWVAFALWAAKIGYQKGHAYAGVVLGATLPYIGVAVIAMFPASKTHSHELPSGSEMIAKVRGTRTATPPKRGKHAA